MADGDEVGGDFLDPADLYLRRGAGVEAGGLHPLAADDPVWGGGLGGFGFGGLCVGCLALFLRGLVVEESRAGEEHGLPVRGRGSCALAL